MSNLSNDLSGPVAEPVGPTEGAAIQHVDESPGSGIAVGSEGPASIVGAPILQAPAPVASSGSTLLFVAEPWYLDDFEPSIEGCPLITRAGTSVPAEFVDQAIKSGADNGVTLVKR